MQNCAEFSQAKALKCPNSSWESLQMLKYAPAMSTYVHKRSFNYMRSLYLSLLDN